MPPQRRLDTCERQISKLTRIHVSVVYTIPWIHWILFNLGNYRWIMDYRCTTVTDIPNAGQCPSTTVGRHVAEGGQKGKIAKPKQTVVCVRYDTAWFVLYSSEWKLNYYIWLPMNTYGKSNLVRFPLFLLFISYYVLITLPSGMTLYNKLFCGNLKGDFSRDFLFQII